MSLLPTSTDLDALRQLQDPLADEAVWTAYRDASGSRLPLWRINQLLDEVSSNADSVPQALPQPLRDLLERDADIGTGRGGWDEERLQRGAEFFERYGLRIAMLLHLMSLPQCYAAARGVQVLCFTHRLERNTLPRIIETAQMVVDVMDAGGLQPCGLGRRTAQKVRLLHAAIRRLLLDSGRWNPAWGMPINQEDLLGTLMTFCVTPLDGMRQIGMQIHAHEAEDYYYRWRAVGQLLGIQPQWIPDSLDEARQIFHLIQRRQYLPCPEGQRLTTALVQMLQEVTPGTVFDPLIPAFMRHLLGAQTADLLGLTAKDDVSRVFALGARFFRLAGGLTDLELARGLLDKLSHSLLTGLLFYYRGPDRPNFALPATLAEKWGFQTPAWAAPMAPLHLSSVGRLAADALAFLHRDKNSHPH